MNAIDLSALETLDHRLRDREVTLHLSEVKGPVMDRLRRSTFLDHLSGQVFVSQFEGYCKLTGLCASRPLRPLAKA